MNGCVAIDFRPGSESVPRIMQLLGDKGFDLYGMHLIPSCEERWTLNVDVGRWWARTELETLERELLGLGGVIEVIHNAAAPAMR